MGRKLPETIDRDDAIRRYRAGEGTSALAREFGVSRNTILRWHKNWPFAPARKSGGRGHAVPAEKIIARYQAGQNLSQIMRELKTSHQRIVKVLKEAGIERRPRSSYPHETSKAHAALRGRTLSYSQKVYRAQCLEQVARERGDFASRHETKMAALLDSRQIAYVPQKAVGIYNLDFALTEVPIAVEVKAGGYTARRRAMLAKRMQDILDSGWWIVEVDLFDTKGAQRFIDEGAVDYVVSFIDEVRRGPTTLREYRVIRRNGQFVTVRGLQNDDGTAP